MGSDSTEATTQRAALKTAVAALSQLKLWSQNQHGAAEMVHEHVTRALKQVLAAVPTAEQDTTCADPYCPYGDEVFELSNEVERLQGLLANVERRQVDIRREVKLLNVENRRLREEQPDRVAMEKKIAKLESNLTQCQHKCAELTRLATQAGQTDQEDFDARR